MGEGPGALKHQIIGTLHAATYMRGEPRLRCRLSVQPTTSTIIFNMKQQLILSAVPLIGFNLVVILLKLIIG
jgi:hypothetical protein